MVLRREKCLEIWGICPGDAASCIVDSLRGLSFKESVSKRQCAANALHGITALVDEVRGRAEPSVWLFGYARVGSFEPISSRLNVDSSVRFQSPRPAFRLQHQHILGGDRRTVRSVRSRQMDLFGAASICPGGLICGRRSDRVPLRGFPPGQKSCRGLFISCALPAFK